MAEIGRWNGHIFEVGPDVIRGFTGLTIKGSSETKDSTSGKEKYISRKNSKPTEVTITVQLNRSMGCEVRDEAIALVEEAYNGKSDYFYVGDYKLVPCQLMLVEAQVKDTVIINGATWQSASVQLSMKQCSKFDTAAGSSSGSGGGGGGGRSGGSSRASTRRTSTTTTSRVSGALVRVASSTTWLSRTASRIANATKKSSGSKDTVKTKAVKSAVKTVNKIVAAAKKVTVKVKKTTSKAKKTTSKAKKKK